jgi:RNA polymerase sigma-70 factor (ECF subfamily)
MVLNAMTTYTPSKYLEMPSSVDDLSDESLLQSIADERAVWALDCLYERYGQKFYSLVYRIVSDHSLAEELVQDAFVAVWQHAASYCPQSGSVRNWLFSIVRHQAIDALRSLRRRSSIKELPWDEIEQEDTTSPDVCEQVSQLTLCSQIREAVKKLPKEQAMVIALAYFQGWTQSEIAESYHLPLGTVKSRMHLGLRHLKQILEQSGVGEMTPSDYADSMETKARPAITVAVQVMEGGCAAEYVLWRDGACTCFGYTEWESLIERIDAFHFHGAVGSFTARKRRRVQGRAYWYAAPWPNAHGRSTYLGRSSELTLARLEEIASKLHEHTN